MKLYRNKNQTLYNCKNKLDYKGYLEWEVVSGIKSKLWEELKDFLLVRLD